MSDACNEPMDPAFAEWLANLPKSEIRYKDEYAPPGECIRCFAAKFSQTHVQGTPGYIHEYENPADLSVIGEVGEK